MSMRGRITFGAVVGLVVIGTVSAHADRVAGTGAPRSDKDAPPSTSAGQHPGPTSGRAADGGTPGRVGGGAPGRAGGDRGATGTPRATTAR